MYSADCSHEVYSEQPSRVRVLVGTPNQGPNHTKSSPISYQLGPPVAPWDAEVGGTHSLEAGWDLYRALLPEPNAIADAV